MLNKLPSVQHELVVFKGGLDLVTPAYQLEGGTLRDCVNFAVNPQGGYYRIPGYERFSGQQSPSDATVTVLTIDFTGVIPSVGDTVTIGGVSAVVCAVGNIGQNYIAVTKYSGGMVVGAVCQKSGVTFGSVLDWYGAASQKDLAQYKAAAANIYRADINPVPGSGPIRGVVFYKDTAYAFRDNVGGTAMGIYKSSSSGWVELPKYGRFAFTSGTDPINEGDTLDHGGHGHSLVVRRLQITSGSLTGGTAAGYIYTDLGATIHSGTWVSSSGGHITVSATTLETVTLPAGGTYDFDVANFTGSADTLRIYGCNGLGDVFELDGSVLVKWSVGTTAYHVKAFKNHLFCSTASSVIHSGIGDPYRYNVIDGAGEIGVGDRVTSMLVQPGSQGGGAMAVYGRSTTWMLYGSSIDDWNFVVFNSGAGGIDFTGQNLGGSYILDDRGVMSLAAGQNYGNFDTATLTNAIRPFIKSKRALACASSLNRERSQYRLFFSDGYGLYCTVANNQMQGVAVVQYQHPVTCSFDGEYSNGDAIALFGTADGHVMENDRGTSFDGQLISAQFITNINTAKTPRMLKRFRRCVIEAQGDSYCEFSVGYNFDWASMDRIQHDFQSGSVSLSPLAYWDSFFWDNFYWDGRGNAPDYIELNGSGENLQIIVSLDADFVSEFSLNSAVIHYTIRRTNR